MFRYSSTGMYHTPLNLQVDNFITSIECARRIPILLSAAPPCKMPLNPISVLGSGVAGWHLFFPPIVPRGRVAERLLVGSIALSFA